MILIVIGLIVFLAKPKTVPPEQAFNAPEIKINFDILKSDKINDLELPPEVEKEFNYQAKTATGIAKSGKISAASPEKATETLTGLGLSSVVLEETITGRINPFVPYYELKPAEKSK